MRGRPKTPTAIKEATGNPGKRSTKTKEPDPDYLQDLSPPEWMPEKAQAIWREEAPKFRKARLLTEIDVLAFAAMCIAAADYRRAVEKTGENDVKANYKEKDGETVAVGEHINPWALVKSMSAKQLTGWLGKFGGTPQDRTRVEINPQASLFGDGDKKKDPAESYFH